MSNNRAPAFQLYPDKLLAGTEHLSDRAFRAYMRILCWMWLHSDTHCRIKNEKQVIARATQLKGRAYASAWQGEIMHPDFQLLKVEGEYLVSNGLRKEAQKQEKRRKQTQDAAKARWEASKRNANAVRNSCPSSPSPFPSPSPAPPPNVEGGVIETEENSNDKVEDHVSIPDLAWARGVFSDEEIQIAWEFTLEQRKTANVRGTMQSCFLWALKNGKEVALTPEKEKIKRSCPVCIHKSRPEMKGCPLCGGTGNVYMTNEEYAALPKAQPSDEENIPF